MRIPAFLRLKITAPIGALLLTLAGASYLFPTSGIFGTWVTRYSSSATGDASCQVCHGLTEQTLNGYGRAVQLQRNAGASTLNAFINIEGANSDSDAGGNSNLAEINAGAQPGWTSGNNTVYDRNSGATSVQQPPSGLLLDPPSQPPPAPEINVTSLALEFGTTTLGTSRTQTTTVQNLGNATLTVSSVTISGNPDFTVDAATPARPFNVAAGGSANVVVRYAPSAAGDDAGQLSIVSNDSDEGTVGVSLHGTGTAPAPICDIDVSPLSRNFGTVQVGQAATQSVSIGNTGTGPCTVNTLTVSPAEFTLGASTPARPFTVQPGATVEVPVNYTPVNAGTDNGTLQVANSDSDESLVTVALTGTGSVPTSCNIQASAMSLNFGGVPIGSSATRSTTLTNTGNANCTVNSVGLSASAEFAINAGLPTLPLTLEPGANVQISLTYTPTNVGDDTGSLNVSTSDPDQPSVSVSLTGSGVLAAQPCDIQVEPLALEFGSVSVGSNRVLSTTISNPGQSPCSVSWQLTGAGDFALVEAAPSSPVDIAPSGNRVVSVRYTPSGSGDDTGTLRVLSNDPDEAEVAVALSGSGFVAAGVMVDLEVTRFEVTRRVQLGGTEPEAVSIRVTLKNNGENDEPRDATVTGVQDNHVVYRETLSVSAPLTRGRRSTATFPVYVPVATGTIYWTVVVDDNNPAGNTAEATTEVRGPRTGGSVEEVGEEGENHEAEEHETDDN